MCALKYFYKQGHKRKRDNADQQGQESSLDEIANVADNNGNSEKVAANKAYKKSGKLP